MPQIPFDQPPLLRLLGLAVRQLSDALSAQLIAAGFTDHRDSFHNVMPHIPAEGIRLTELADRGGMSKQAMAELVAEAERLGYLHREPDPTDGRAKLIRFTDKGWAAVEAALTALHNMEGDLTLRLGEPAVRRLRMTLLRLLDQPS